MIDFLKKYYLLILAFLSFVLGLVLYLVIDTTKFSVIFFFMIILCVVFLTIYLNKVIKNVN